MLPISTMMSFPSRRLLVFWRINGLNLLYVLYTIVYSVFSSVNLDFFYYFTKTEIKP